MKPRRPLIIALSLALLAFAGTALADDALSQPGSVAHYDTPQGELTVISKPAPVLSYGPAPSFEQLSGGKPTITAAQARAYPPLLNDFGYADSEHTGHLTEAEYQHWLKQA